MHCQTMYPRPSLSCFTLAWTPSLTARAGTKHSLKAYPYLESEDINEALRYATYLAEDETVEFAG